MIRKSNKGKTDKLVQEIDDSVNINDSSIAAKMNRLKIEESHLLKTLNSTIINNISDININDNQITEYQKPISKLKELYQNISIVFQDIKGSTSTQEAIRSLDISEVEENIVELEGKIRYLKNHIEVQLSSLKLDEKELTEELKKNPREIWIKTGCKKQGQKYKEIIPSPVRFLRTSSLKSSEVQEFQDFISTSKNRFGGWNEYHHNIFTACWRKYFQLDSSSTDFENFVIKIERSNCFQSFLQELLRKLECFKTDEIITHSKWYARYVYLRDRQQIAINKWKTNKLLIKKSISKVELHTEATSHKSTSPALSDRNRTRRTAYSASLDQDRIEEGNKDQTNSNIRINKRTTLTRGNDKNLPRLQQYNKPTKQWLSRCQTIENSSAIYTSNLENLTKLRIPNWRIGL